MERAWASFPAPAFPEDSVTRKCSPRFRWPRGAVQLGEQAARLADRTFWRRMKWVALKLSLLSYRWSEKVLGVYDERNGPAPSRRDKR
jgi:hypothetical protein